MTDLETLSFPNSSTHCIFQHIERKWPLQVDSFSKKFQLYVSFSVFRDPLYFSEAMLDSNLLMIFCFAGFFFNNYRSGKETTGVEIFKSVG